jgi:toxin YoeB
VNVVFAVNGWRDYRYWFDADPDTAAKVNALIDDILRNPFRGLGKPEPLKGALSGWWSRRITGDHRLVYRIEGKRGMDQRVVILACRYHYERD